MLLERLYLFQFRFGEKEDHFLPIQRCAFQGIPRADEVGQMPDRPAFTNDFYPQYPLEILHVITTHL